MCGRLSVRLCRRHCGSSKKGGSAFSCQCANSHRRIPFTPRSPNSLLLCSPSLMREKRAHYGHWCSSNECLFSVFWTICLAPDTESHGHGHPPLQIHLFMGLNQACDGPRIPTTGAFSALPSERGSCVAHPHQPGQGGGMSALEEGNTMLKVTAHRELRLSSLLWKVMRCWATMYSY